MLSRVLAHLLHANYHFLALLFSLARANYGSRIPRFFLALQKSRGSTSLPDRIQTEEAPYLSCAMPLPLASLLVSPLT